MLQIPARFEFLCRLSLSFLWLFTAATSFWWARAIGYEILAQQSIQGEFADWCINTGSFLDALIGIWLLTAYKPKWCYGVQIILILSYSILLTLIAPGFWFHPFGPITINIPILTLLFLLHQARVSATSPVAAL
jgi:hypothetical protein